MYRERWARFVASIRQAQSGSVGIIFGLTAIPMIFVAGTALDYSRASSAKAALDAILDASVVSIVAKDTNTFDPADAKAKAKAYFDAQSASVPDATIHGFDLTVTPGSNSVTVTASYDASIQTTLTRILKFDKISLKGIASGSRNFFLYMDFYILLDNSPSMGLGATTDDINLLQSVTSPSCAFACHEHAYQNNVVIGDNLNDNYHIAKRNKVTLRIDVLRTATQKLVDTAVATAKLSQQFRMAIYTFSDVFQKISDLTSVLSQTKADAAAINLAYAYQDRRDTQTSYDRALPAINGVIPDSGDGVTPQTSNKFLFLVTDGVQDEDVVGLPGKVGGSWSWNRLMSAIDPNLCKAMKDRGIKVAVLYTAYLPLPGDASYDRYIAPIAPTIPANLQACASPGLYFQASVSGGIDQAMQQMFQAAVASVRLTN